MTAAGLDHPARASGAGAGPLAGVRVLELGTPGPAPWGCMVLASLGASVLRVERPGAAHQPFPGRAVLGRDRTLIEADLKTDAGRQRVRDLVPHADVLVEGFRPGVTERLGLGPDDCLRVNPGLIYARMTGWGQTGPLAPEAGHDINYLAASGALAAMVEEGQAPSYPLAAALTFGGGSMFLLLGITAALYERASSGRGQVVDAAVADGLSMLLASAYGLLADTGLMGPPPVPAPAPFYGTYSCADGDWVAVAPMEPDLWAAFTAVLELDDEGERSDPARWPELRKRIAERFSSRPRPEWIDAFADVDAAVTPVLRMQDVPAQSHARARELFATFDGVVQPTTAPRFSRTPGIASGGPRAAGEWDEVLAPAPVGGTPSEPSGEEIPCP
jgi:alpha-methylacyl-CoA racemase